MRIDRIMIKTIFCFLSAGILLFSCEEKKKNDAQVYDEAQQENEPKGAPDSTGLKVGDIAPQLAFKNPAGKEVQLSSLRGKVVLIDFWASWCGPCRGENPNVVRMYQKYKDKGFEIYGVSFDQNKEDWEDAIQKDKLTWVHVSDLGGWQSQAARIYGITSIPSTVLLDKNGRIVARDLRGPTLEAKLEEIFGS